MGRWNSNAGTGAAAAAAVAVAVAAAAVVCPSWACEGGGLAGLVLLGP